MWCNANTSFLTELPLNAHGSLLLTLSFSTVPDLNTLDWSKNNTLAIGLGPSVFLWNASSGSVNQLTELAGEGEYVASLSWAGNGKYLAVGGSNSAIHLWDVEKEKRLRVLKGHSDRVGVLAWNRHSLSR